eukprot:TRINITY_DN17069_c0_g1_i2.p1 TRINITY_DN17069_c0_g1~~TRINITY_DN17069_c0_g1_i2.p1  ORF type:complete len:455 (-),score=105.03 TRINITY_DN17069_c0_g1_i2:37-1401(-)
MRRRRPRRSPLSSSSAASDVYKRQKAAQPLVGGAHQVDGAVEPTLTQFSAFLLLLKINWGIGMMAMPYYIHKAGLWLGIAFFVCTMILTVISIDRLLRVRFAVLPLHGDAATSTYTGLMRVALGEPGELSALFSIFLANYGSCVAYIKYMGDNLHKFLPEAGVPSWVWILLLTLPFCGASLLDDVSILGRISFIGIVAGEAFAITLLATATTDGPGSLSDYVNSTNTASWDTLPVAMGLAIFCNEGMVILIPPVHRAMGSCDWAVLRTPVVLMAIVFTLNYMAVAVGGAYLFEPPMDDISLDLQPSRAIHRAAVYCYVLQLVISYVVVFFSVADATQSVIQTNPRFDRIKALQASQVYQSYYLGPCFRVLAVAIASLIAIGIPNFGDFISFAGAIANTLGIYVLPHVSFLVFHFRRRLVQPATKVDVGLSCFIVGFGAVTGSIAAVVAFKDMVS